MPFRGYSLGLETGEQRLAELDGVRGLAILLVVMFHGFISLSPAFRLGAFGVDLFFVLSGFLISGILLDQRPYPNYYGTFFARRAIRILPLYAVWTALFLVLAWAWHPAPGTVRYDNFGMILPVGSYLTFTQNFAVAARNSFGAQWMGPTWSLAVEEQFYLLLPVLVRYASRESLARYSLAALAIAPLFRLAMSPLVGGEATWLLLPCRMDSFAWGILLALATRRLVVPRWYRRLGAVMAVVAAPLVILYVAGGFSGVLSAVVMPSAVSALWAALLGSVVLFRLRWTRVLRSKVLTGLGTITYGVYIVHQGINHLLHDLLFGARPTATSIGGFGLTLAALGISVFLAVISWRWLEKPLTDWGRGRFRYSRVSQVPVADVPALALR